MNYIGSYRSLWLDSPSIRNAVTVSLLALVIGVTEALLVYGSLQYAIPAYTLLVAALSLAPLTLDIDVPLLKAFILLPVFRLVNLTMPVFFESTLFWLATIHVPFILVALYLGYQREEAESESRTQTDSEVFDLGYELPWWLGGAQRGHIRGLVRSLRSALGRPANLSRRRRILYALRDALVVLLIPVVIVGFLWGVAVSMLYLVQMMTTSLNPGPLVQSLEQGDLTLLATTMLVVGFVEELLFRGILQKGLERRLGLLPGLLVASALFGVMSVGFELPMALVAAVGVGLLFGVVYDLTGSLVFVSLLHGVFNVFLFGVIPLREASAFKVVQELLPTYLDWLVVFTLF